MNNGKWRRTRERRTKAQIKKQNKRWIPNACINQINTKLAITSWHVRYMVTMANDTCNLRTKQPRATLSLSVIYPQWRRTIRSILRTQTIVTIGRLPPSLLVTKILLYESKKHISLEYARCYFRLRPSSHPMNVKWTWPSMDKLEQPNTSDSKRSSHGTGGQHQYIFINVNKTIQDKNPSSFRKIGLNFNKSIRTSGVCIEEDG